VQNLEHKNDDHTQYPFFQLQNLCIFNYTSKEWATFHLDERAVQSPNRTILVSMATWRYQCVTKTHLQYIQDLHRWVSECVSILSHPTPICLQLCSHFLQLFLWKSKYFSFCCIHIPFHNNMRHVETHCITLPSAESTLLLLHQCCRQLYSQVHSVYLLLQLEDLQIQTLKVKTTLCAPWKHRWGTEVQLHSFLTSELDKNEHSTSCLSSFIPSENAGTHRRGG